MPLGPVGKSPSDVVDPVSECIGAAERERRRSVVGLHDLGVASPGDEAGQSDPGAEFQHVASGQRCGLLCQRFGEHGGRIPQQQAEGEMNELVRQVRNIRAEMALPPSEKTELFILGTPHDWKTAEEHQNILTALTPTAKITFTTQEPASFGASALVGKLKLMIPIPESMKAKEKARLEKEREKLEKLFESTQGKLANEEFRSRAPREVVEKLELALAQTQKQLSDIAVKLKSFQ